MKDQEIFHLSHVVINAFLLKVQKFIKIFFK